MPKTNKNTTSIPIPVASKQVKDIKGTKNLTQSKITNFFKKNWWMCNFYYYESYILLCVCI